MSQPAFDFGDELDDAANPTYTVSELADAVNSVLRRGFSDGVWVRGEIQGWSERNGHAYFSLADDTPGRQAVVRVQLFAPARNRLRPLLARHRLELAEGMKVRIFGHLDFYAPSGQLGLKMVDLDPRFTLGDLAQQRDQVLRRLAADGALEANRRHRLVRVPLRIGVVASAGTAAWHDFHDELVRSGYGFHVLLADTRVQGPDAPRYVSRALAALSRHAERRGLDAIVVIRGGGARNEMATFDAEPIARAIAAAPVPVLTGLGHEIDRSVADEVAHTSLKTPTACATALVQAVGGYLGAVEQAWSAVTVAARARLTGADRGVAERAHRIERRTSAAVGRATERLGGRVHRLRTGARRPLVDGARRLDEAVDRLSSRVPPRLAAEERHLAGLEARVRALDPVNVLARGWTITRAADGSVVRAPDRVAAGDVITTQFASGTVSSRVEPEPREAR
jgi:exodeoxyribonuclease VII large subunit